MPLIQPLLLTLLISLLAHPAQARPRTSSCVEPPAAIPEVERNAIEAQVSAQVKAIQAGGDASARAEQETSFQVSGFSQQGFETAWYIYAMCRQKEAGTISEAQYASFLEKNGMMTSSPAAKAPESSVATEPEFTGDSGLSGDEPELTETWDLAIPPEEVAGVWNITTTLVHSTCALPTDTKIIYVWLVGEKLPGIYTVEVQGSTNYPRLEGEYRDEMLYFRGSKTVQLGQDVVTNQSIFELSLRENHMVGTRDSLLLTNIGPNQWEICQIRMAVSGIRQG